MTEQIIIKGYWWLPSSPDTAVAGILTYTPNESIVLELVGQLSVARVRFPYRKALLPAYDATSAHLH